MPTCLTIKILAIIPPVPGRTHSNSTTSRFLQEASSSPWACQDTRRCSRCNRCTPHRLLSPSMPTIPGLMA